LRRQTACGCCRECHEPAFKRLLAYSWTDLSALPEALTATLLAFCCIWAADIGAYFFGKFFGRTRLSHISPKKTVEGAIFGLLGSIAVATAGAWYLHWPTWQLSGIILGTLVGMLAS
jgi:phosphatidate cytidylyltransferase